MIISVSFLIMLMLYVDLGMSLKCYRGANRKGNNYSYITNECRPDDLFPFVGCVVVSFQDSFNRKRAYAGCFIYGSDLCVRMSKMHLGYEIDCKQCNISDMCNEKWAKAALDDTAKTDGVTNKDDGGDNENSENALYEHVNYDVYLITATLLIIFVLSVNL